MLPHPPSTSSSLPSRPYPQPCGHRPGLQEGVQGHPRPRICALGKAMALGDTSDGGPPPHLWDPVSRLCEAEEQGFRVVEGTRACMKRAWVSGVILPVTRAFQAIHSVPAHGRGREPRMYPVLWAGAGHSGPCYTLPIHAPHPDLCCGGSSATSLVGFRHCTPGRGGVLVPYLPARAPPASHTPGRRGICGPHYTGLRPHSVAPQTRHTGQSALGARMVLALRTRNGRQRAHRTWADGAPPSQWGLGNWERGGYRHLVDCCSLTWF